MTPPPQWVVSVEGAPVPARAAVLKALQTRVGLVAVPDNERHGPHALTRRLGLLLHRVRGVARCLPHHAAALLCGPWLAPDLAPGPDVLLHDLYSALSAELAEHLLGGAGRMRHLMLCLDASPHEAFEAIVEEGAKDAAGHGVVTLQGLIDAQRAVDAARPAALVTPFGPVTIARLRCPCFAADNPATLQCLADEACSLVADAIAAAPA